MKILGSLFRCLLNINTIWGLMILVSFGLCVGQHYLPTTTAIPTGALQEGHNSLTIRLKGPEGQVKAFDCPVWLNAGNLVLSADAKDENRGRPWLISTRQVNGGHLLKWDSDDYGRYEVVLNNTTVERGSLVTLQSLTDAAFSYAQKGFDITLGLVAAMVLFLGLMKVGEHAGIVQLAARLFHPLIRLLFPQVPRDHPASGAILMNVTTTVLGLGNAATPFGLKAMKELQDLNPNPDVASDSQVTLLAINTAGFALLPTTLLAVRKSAGCSDPFEIIGTCMIGGAVATIVAVIAARLLGKLSIFSVRAALAEPSQESASGSERDAASVSDRSISQGASQ
ncbi:MAG: nucleoside recognition domain-containing protein [Phycisphaerae bacterium]|nr:nucleoside recognition domain-containing protein [Phycisphaerae bacterium]